MNGTVFLVCTVCLVPRLNDDSQSHLIIQEGLHQCCSFLNCLRTPWCTFINWFLSVTLKLSPIRSINKHTSKELIPSHLFFTAHLLLQSHWLIHQVQSFCAHPQCALQLTKWHSCKFFNCFISLKHQKTVSSALNLNRMRHRRWIERQTWEFCLMQSVLMCPLAWKVGGGEKKRKKIPLKQQENRDTKLSKNEFELIRLVQSWLPERGKNRGEATWRQQKKEHLTTHSLRSLWVNAKFTWRWKCISIVCQRNVNDAAQRGTVLITRTCPKVMPFSFHLQPPVRCACHHHSHKVQQQAPFV